MLDLELTDLRVSYPGLGAPVLDIPALCIAAGAQVALTGPSGSGKSTFVHVVTALARPGQGRVRWGGTELSALGEGAADRWRGAHVGLVLQDFHLFAGLSALDNVLLPARLARALPPDGIGRARDLLARCGLQRPGQAIETLSRGEMQRVAVARALLRRPGVIVADEPTASLDAEHAASVGGLLVELAAAEGATLIVVSHDARLTARLARRLTLANGRIVADQSSTENTQDFTAARTAATTAATAAAAAAMGSAGEGARA
ncbi:MAG: ATP-binding cassette domain-containing protein [Comamonas sp.]